MRLIVAVTSLLFLLTGCGEQSTFEKLIKADLIDSESAQFRDLVLSDNKSRACLSYNAKNRFGGYVGWSVAMFEKREAGWHLTVLNSSPMNCSEPYFTAMDESEKAKKIAELEFVEMVATLNQISKPEALTLSDSQSCRMLKWNYGFESGMIAYLKHLKSSSARSEAEVDKVIEKFKGSDACKISKKSK